MRARFFDWAALVLPFRAPAWIAKAARMLMVPIIFVIVWHIIASALNDPTILPRPRNVALAFWNSMSGGEIWPHVLASLKRIGIAYALSVAIGVPLGVLMGVSSLVDDIFSPFLEMLRPIPGLAVLPLLLVLIGLGDKLIISVVVFAAFFPIVVNTSDAIRGVDRLYQQAALTFGASSWTIAREVIFPAALPGILNGLRIGLSFAWMSIIGAEFIGTLQGLGYLMTWYQRLFVVDKVVMVMVIIGLLGLLLDRGLRLIRRLLLPWYIETGMGSE